MASRPGKLAAERRGELPPERATKTTGPDRDSRGATSRGEIEQIRMWKRGSAARRRAGNNPAHNRSSGLGDRSVGNESLAEQRHQHVSSIRNEWEDHGRSTTATISSRIAWGRWPMIATSPRSSPTRRRMAGMRVRGCGAGPASLGRNRSFKFDWLIWPPIESAIFLPFRRGHRPYTARRP